jgi:DNA-binding MarR family transcriptional regulator
LSLTAAGRRIYERVAPAALEAEAEVLADLEPGERAVLRSLLERVEHTANRSLKRDP